MEKLDAKRKRLGNHELQPDMRQRNVRLRTKPEDDCTCNSSRNGDCLNLERDRIKSQRFLSYQMRENRNCSSGAAHPTASNLPERSQLSSKDDDTVVSATDDSNKTDGGGDNSGCQGKRSGNGEATSTQVEDNDEQQPPPAKPCHANGGGAANNGRRRAIRHGPCHFGCEFTTNVRNGVQVWKAPLVPSPWPGVGDDAALCNKCYSRGVALRKRAIQEASWGSNRNANYDQPTTVNGGDTHKNRGKFQGAKIRTHVNDGTVTSPGQTAKDGGTNDTPRSCEDCTAASSPAIRPSDTACKGQCHPANDGRARNENGRANAEGGAHEITTQGTDSGAGAMTRAQVHHATEMLSVKNKREVSRTIPRPGSKSGGGGQGSNSLEVVGCKKNYFPALQCGCAECKSNTIRLQDVDAPMADLCNKDCTCNNNGTDGKGSTRPCDVDSNLKEPYARAHIGEEGLREGEMPAGPTGPAGTGVNKSWKGKEVMLMGGQHTQTHAEQGKSQKRKSGGVTTNVDPNERQRTATSADLSDDDHQPLSMLLTAPQGSKYADGKKQRGTGEHKSKVDKNADAKPHKMARENNMDNITDGCLNRRHSTRGAAEVNKDKADAGFTTGYMATTGCKKDRYPALRCGCARCDGISVRRNPSSYRKHPTDDSNSPATGTYINVQVCEDQGISACSSRASNDEGVSTVDRGTLLEATTSFLDATTYHKEGEVEKEATKSQHSCTLSERKVRQAHEWKGSERHARYDGKALATSKGPHGSTNPDVKKHDGDSDDDNQLPSPLLGAAKQGESSSQRSETEAVFDEDHKAKRQVREALWQAQRQGKRFTKQAKAEDVGSRHKDFDEYDESHRKRRRKSEPESVSARLAAENRDGLRRG